MTSQIDRPLLNTDEAAARANLSKSTMNKLRCSGCGPDYVKFGKSVRYSPGDVDAWINSLKRSNTSEQLHGGLVPAPPQSQRPPNRERPGASDRERGIR